MASNALYNGWLIHNKVQGTSFLTLKLDIVKNSKEEHCIYVRCT